MVKEPKIFGKLHPYLVIHTSKLKVSKIVFEISEMFSYTKYIGYFTEVEH